ncbi:MAG: hypothetical protein IH614_16830 [Desulfuromonadales bacterium]|nr:hypothetical protein [Desulfuromonadales bacterium]
MPLFRDTVVSCPVDLPRSALRRMVQLVRLLEQLSRRPAYREAVWPEVPLSARHDPGHAAVMMGYDFHLDGAGHPWLIEVNTNAGGALLAYLAHHPSASQAQAAMPERLLRRFLDPFAAEMHQFSHGRLPRPSHLVIIDERPPEQFLYREMEALAQLFRQSWGTRVSIVDPQQLQAGAEGVFADGQRVDLIYNRHCDFYLESPPLAGVRAAWLAGTVCLTPNPFIYGLLGDKRRMGLWSDAASLPLLGLNRAEIDLLTGTVPSTCLLTESNREELWRSRQQWVFKPVDRFGSRGVFLGRKISRTRFDLLPPTQTLAQREIPPSETFCTPDEPMKTDFRLFAYRQRPLGVTARLYRGQVTNLRTPGGGFAPVRIFPR